MTAASAGPDASIADLDAARLVLARMGLSAHDLPGAPAERAPMPTFAEYIPIVAGRGQRRRPARVRVLLERVLEQWGDKRLDEPTPSQIKPLVEQVKLTVVARRNARGGRSAGEHLIARAALRLPPR